MNVSLYEAAAAMTASTRWQEVIAENISAGQVPGYKKQNLSFEAVQAGMMPASASTIAGAAERVGLPSARVSTNFSQGELKSTGGSLDLALEGQGFFEVQMPDGSTGYTRDGELRLNGEGQLTTKDGYALMGDGGPLQLDPANHNPISVAASGEVSQGSEVKGRIKVTQFDDPARLTPVGSGYFVAVDHTLVPQPAGATTVRQGFLESSNLSSVGEMVSLISALRMNEASQRVIQAYDDRMGRAISELGTPI